MIEPCGHGTYEALFMTHTVCTRMATSVVALGVAAGAVSARQNDAIELRTVVGCLARDGDTWTLEQATSGEPSPRAFTSREELDASRALPLGSRGVRHVDAHLEHKVQAKGLWVNAGGELRLNVTSFQHLAPICE